MKSKSIIKTLGTGLVTLFLMMLSVASYSQACPGNQATVTLSNITSPTATTLEFDVNVANTGTTSMSLVGLAGSIVPSAGLVQAGSTNTFEVITTPQQGEFTNFNTVNPSIGATSGRWIWTNSPASSGAKVALPTGVYKRFCRFRLTSSLPLVTSGSTLTVQNITGVGQNTTIVTVYCGINTNSTGLSASTAGTLVTTGAYSLQTCATSGTASVTHPACFGGTGSALVTLSPIPSVTAITYTVDGGASTSATVSGAGTFTVSGLSAGTHSIVVSNAGCANTVTVSATVNAPAQLVASASAGSIACFGGSTTVNVSATGGTAPYTGTGLFTVNAGSYSYTVTDANGCSSTASGSVSQPTALSASSNAGTIACHGGTTTVTVSATGGTAPYTGTGSFTVSGGSYSYTVTDANGCTATTTGTVTDPAALTNTTTESVCGSYTWSVNGQTYTESGTYTATNNSGACPVAETLVLTITPATSNTTTASACGTYHWSVNDQNYTASGTYTDVRGCHTEILVLTITPSSTHTTTESACGSYTWANNGQTYTTSGNYTGTTTNCVTEVLALTITPNSTHTTSVTTCQEYTWSENGQTYTTSGTYTNVTGCHTEVLNLTIQNGIITQPANTFICSTAGSTATYSVGVDYAGATYQWQYRVVTKTAPDPVWITITAANAAVYQNYNTATLTVTKTATMPAVGTEYRVLVGGSDCGPLTSNTATVLIISTTKAGTIATPSASVCVGSDLTFTLSAYAATSFQWQSSPISTATVPGVFTDIPGATGTTYTLTNAQLNSDRSYRVVVGNSCSGLPATSATKTITVNAPSVAGTIAGGGTICSGSSASMKISGNLGKTQWEYSTDGVNYVNAPKAADAQTVPFSTTSTSSTGTTYIASNMTAELYFRVRVTNGACSSVYTTPVHYVLSTEALVGTASAANTLICPATGTTITLSSATGIVTWQKSTNFATANPTWANTTNHTLSYPTGNLAASTAFRASVTIGSCSTVLSNVVIVAVVAKPLAKPLTANVTSPTGSATAPLCTTDASKVLTVGVGTIGDVQWQWSTTSTTTGFTDIAGATGNSYTITNPSVGANYYRVKLSNSCGVVVFGTAVTVNYKNCAPAKVEVKAPFGVTAYPNPYSATFNLSLSTSSEELVGVTIYDMTGKLIDKREVRPSDVSELQVGDRYPSGVYNVVVTQGSDVKTLRVIKR